MQRKRSQIKRHHETSSAKAGRSPDCCAANADQIGSIHTASVCDRIRTG